MPFELQVVAVTPAGDFPGIIPGEESSAGIYIPSPCRPGLFGIRGIGKEIGKDVRERETIAFFQFALQTAGDADCGGGLEAIPEGLVGEDADDFLAEGLAQFPLVADQPVLPSHAVNRICINVGYADGSATFFTKTDPAVKPNPLAVSDVSRLYPSNCWSQDQAGFMYAAHPNYY